MLNNIIVVPLGSTSVCFIQIWSVRMVQYKVLLLNSSYYLIAKNRWALNWDKFIFKVDCWRSHRSSRNDRYCKFWQHFFFYGTTEGDCFTVQFSSGGTELDNFFPRKSKESWMPALVDESHCNNFEWAWLIQCRRRTIIPFGHFIWDLFLRRIFLERNNSTVHL